MIRDLQKRFNRKQIWVKESIELWLLQRGEAANAFRNRRKMRSEASKLKKIHSCRNGLGHRRTAAKLHQTGTATKPPTWTTGMI